MPATTNEARSYGIWPTAWGPMGAAACEAGLVAVELPHYPAGRLAERLARRHPGAVRDETPFERVIALSQAYFDGTRVSFDDVRCVLPSEATFAGKVLRACRAIGFGRRVSYGELARRIGRPRAARAVASALSRNPIPLIVPCHRIVYADGSLGGFSAPGGVTCKERMLGLEEAAACS